jgi:hypothetical protein
MRYFPQILCSCLMILSKLSLPLNYSCILNFRLCFYLFYPSFLLSCLVNSFAVSSAFQNYWPNDEICVKRLSQILCQDFSPPRELLTLHLLLRFFFTIKVGGGGVKPPNSDLVSNLRPSRAWRQFHVGLRRHGTLRY